MTEEYVLGRSGHELTRLDLQGVLYREITQRAMVNAGITEGMSVLDVGCGSGDVTRLAGQLVGPSGSVLGIDYDEETIQGESARSEGPQSANVSFRMQEVSSDIPGQPFDAGGVGAGRDNDPVGWRPYLQIR